jgi:hypothetical protein
MAELTKDDMDVGVPNFLPDLEKMAPATGLGRGSLDLAPTEIRYRGFMDGEPRIHEWRVQIVHGTVAMVVGEGPLLGILSMLHTMLRLVIYVHFFVVYV